jgi:dienelactone hydrolase
VNIPLEYFTKAFDWMAKQQEIDTRLLALVGGSRGAELALILGSTFPVVKAVVGYAPSSVVWGACGGITSIGKPAWAYRNKPLSPIRMGLSLGVLCEHVKMGLCLVSRVPYRETPLFLAALENESAVNQAIISVENIKGPILLISGDDDQLSPSTLMSEMIMDRLRRHEHPFAYKHVKCEGAGHAINLPDLPREAYPTKMTHSLTHITYDLGGDPDINAQAAKQAWNEVVAFLKEHVTC